MMSLISVGSFKNGNIVSAEMREDMLRVNVIDGDCGAARRKEKSKGVE